MSLYRGPQRHKQPLYRSRPVPLVRRLGHRVTCVDNGRVALEVVGGNGRVTGYASNIDNQTKDPTYIPAQ